MKMPERSSSLNTGDAWSSEMVMGLNSHLHIDMYL